MKKNIIIAILALVAIGSFSYAAYLTVKKPAVIPSPAATTEQTTTTSQPTDSTNIHVFSPKSGDEVGLPIKVLGEVRTFENGYVVRIKDAKGNILREESGTALNGDAGQFNLFQSEINYPLPTTSAGTIEVFDYSAKDGSEIDKVTIPIKFGLTNYTNIKIYFTNNIDNPNSKDCQAVSSVSRRVSQDKDIAANAIKELLLGPTTAEAAKGFYNSINTGVTLNSIKIDNGVATVDFNDVLQAGVSGSCQITAIRAQITQTLKQFPTVKSVVISINGNSQGILQP